MNLKQALRDTLTDQELHVLVRSYDVVGDIAVVIIPPELAHRAPAIGAAVLSLNRKIKVVARRAGTCSGEYRTMPLEIIAGENRLETVHREFGISIALNVQDSYFSSRTGTERKRVADHVGDGESVLVMFSGVAPFPLMIARFSGASAITGIEKNEAAHRWAQRNVQKNRFAQRIRLLRGDVREIVPTCGGGFDRIVMPLPVAAISFLDLAISALNPGGRLHVYDFQPPASFGKTGEAIELAARNRGRTARIDDIVVCGHNTPATHRTCTDATISDP